MCTSVSCGRRRAGQRASDWQRPGQQATRETNAGRVAKVGRRRRRHGSKITSVRARCRVLGNNPKSYNPWVEHTPARLKVLHAAAADALGPVSTISLMCSRQAWGKPAAKRCRVESMRAPCQASAARLAGAAIAVLRMQQADY